MRVTGNPHASPREKVDDLLEFVPSRAHLLLEEVYGDHLYHNIEMHLDRGMVEDSLWYHCCHRLDIHSSRFYSMSPGEVGKCFMVTLVEEWQGVLDQRWNSKRPLIFAHVIWTKKMGSHCAQDIRPRIILRMDLW